MKNPVAIVRIGQTSCKNSRKDISHNVRVGIEDNLYLGRGVKAKSNAEQIEKIIRIARALGIESATPNETREVLELKELNDVNF
jgi:hypothetical protein